MAVDSKSIAYAPLTNDSPDTVTPPFDDWNSASNDGAGQPRAHIGGAAAAAAAASIADSHASAMRASMSTPNALTTSRATVAPYGWSSLEQDDAGGDDEDNDCDCDRSIKGVNAHERARLLPPTEGSRTGGLGCHANVASGSLLAVPSCHALAIATPTVIAKHAHQLPPRPRPRLGHQRALSPPKTSIGRPFSSSLSRLPLLAGSSRHIHCTTPFDSPCPCCQYESGDDNESKFRQRAYSNNCTMPAYGPGGRTLVKGATVTTASPRGSCNSPSTFHPKHGRSCDLTMPMHQTSIDDETGSLRTYNNPIAQVSESCVSAAV
uniref:Uncharacterized protein n=1 Tax=Plectus sambesii TaxID=2011161 RepID=A0A914VBW3_9BILA